MGADVVLRGAADCVRVAVTTRIGLFLFVVCRFLRFGISFSSSGVFRALFFYVFFNDRKRIKNANRPFRSCGFRCLFAALGDELARDVKL